MRVLALAFRVLVWAVLGLLVVVVTGAGLGVLVGPALLAPATSYSMEADPARVEAFEARLAATGRELLRNPDRTASLELEEADLNALLAAAAANLSAQGEVLVPWAVVSLLPGEVRLAGAVVLADSSVPRALRGRPIGLDVRLEPRVTGERLELTVLGLRLGRIPLPPGLVLGVAGRALPLPPELGLDWRRRQITLALPDLAPPDAGAEVRLTGLEVDRERLTVLVRLVVPD